MPDLRRLSLRLLRDTIGEFGWRYKAYLAAYVLISAIYLLPPEFLRFFTEGAAGLEEIPTKRFLVLLLGFGAGIAVCLWLSVYLSALLGEWLRLMLSLKLRRKTMDGLHRTSLETLDSAQRGDWLTRMTSDLRNVEFFAADSLPEQIHQLTILVGALTLFLWRTGPVGLIPLGFALLLAWLNVRIQRKMAPALTEAREREGEIFQFLIESFEGLRTIRSYRAEKLVATRLNAGLDRLYAVSMRVIRRMGALMGVNELGSQLAITACLTLLAWSLKSGQLSASDVLVYPFYLTLFLGAAKTLVASAYDWNRFFVEGGRLAQVCYAAENSTDRPDASDSADPMHVGTLEIRELGLTFPGQPPLFQDFSLKLRTREILALVGPSGCGKSTLLEVIAGLREPTHAKFFADGHALDAIPIELSSYVEQRPYIFAGSFRENLSFDLANHGDGLIHEALEKLGLVSLVKERGGLGATLNDRGQNLSEGQRYRIGLARAMLMVRPFLLVDEPFAALDENSVRSAIEALHLQRDRGKGIVLATHQLPAELEVTHVVALPAHASSANASKNGSRSISS